MANTSAPFGFRQWSGTGSAPTYEQVTLVGGINYNTGAIYNGDPVARVSSSDGTITQASANGSTGSTIAGIFSGCKYLSTSQKRIVWSNYWPGSDVSSANQSVTEAYIINDPNAQFLAQVGGSSSTGLTAAQVGLNVNFNLGTGNASSGVSGAYIDISVTPATTSTLPFRFVSLVTNPPGANGTSSGAYNYAVVAFNNVETKNPTAV